MELRHLRYFVAVAEAGHFGHAAEQTGVAQSGLSRQIQQLEHELGVVLLRRFPRVRLTEAGLAFLRHAREILDHAERAAREAVSVHRGEVGHLRVGYVDAVTYDGRFPEICAAFRKHHPEVDLQLHFTYTADAAAALLDGQFDVAFLGERPAAAELVAEQFLRLEFAALLPRAHPLAARERIQAAELGDDPFISFPRRTNPALHDALAAACRAAGLERRIAHESRRGSELLGLVAAGAGVTLTPAAFALAAPPGVAFVAVDDLVLQSWVWYAWRDGAPSRALADFLALVRWSSEVAA